MFLSEAISCTHNYVSFNAVDCLWTGYDICQAWTFSSCSGFRASGTSYWFPLSTPPYCPSHRTRPCNVPPPLLSTPSYCTRPTDIIIPFLIYWNGADWDKWRKEYSPSYNSGTSTLESYYSNFIAWVQLYAQKCLKYRKSQYWHTRHGVLTLFSLETYNLYSIASQLKRLFDPVTIGISHTGQSV